MYTFTYYKNKSNKNWNQFVNDFWGKWQQVFNSWHVFINILEQEKWKCDSTLKWVGLLRWVQVDWARIRLLRSCHPSLVIPNDLNGQICLLQFHKGYTLLLLEVFDGFLTSSAIYRPRMAGHWDTSCCDEKEENADRWVWEITHGHLRTWESSMCKIVALQECELCWSA